MAQGTRFGERTKLRHHLKPATVANLPEKIVDFAPANEKAKLKSDVINEDVAKLSFHVRKYRISYEELCDMFKRIRKETKLVRKKRERRLPQLLTESKLKTLFNLIVNPEHHLMMQFLFKTAIRVHELVSVRISDIDLGNHKVFINQGKGAKDRYVLFPESMRLDLTLYIDRKKDGYLFESRQAQQVQNLWKPSPLRPVLR